MLDGFHRINAARLEIRQRLGRGLEHFVVIVDHLIEQYLFIGIWRHRRIEDAHRGALDRARPSG